MAPSLISLGTNQPNPDSLLEPEFSHHAMYHRLSIPICPRTPFVRLQAKVTSDHCFTHRCTQRRGRALKQIRLALCSHNIRGSETKHALFQPTLCLCSPLDGKLHAIMGEVNSGNCCYRFTHIFNTHFPHMPLKLMSHYAELCI